MQKLTEAELHASLSGLNGWQVVNGKLHRVYKFLDFTQAFGFMTRLLSNHPIGGPVTRGPAPLCRDHGQ